ncbi:hypothetical protein [Brevundimonas sp.]|uniref:hypothetical protein n=1 Tax=Brevundimonas sp. TaxID=1871086 RepID=UPI002ABB4DF9|nr:hypothetical protein [Brevundimonas sp.]MDZ4362143.1 hypothetical protein [Brevundimonas sp.]
MSRCIQYLAGPADLPGIEQSATSKGLIFIRGDEYQSTPAQPGEAAYHGWFSIKPANQLKLYRDRPCEALDPMLHYRPSCIEDGYITIGNVFENQDNELLACQTKTHFERVSRWIRKWPRDSTFGVNIGPQAQSLIDAGLMPVNWIPGTVEGFMVDVSTGLVSKIADPDTNMFGLNSVSLK